MPGYGSAGAEASTPPGGWRPGLLHVLARPLVVRCWVVGVQVLGDVGAGDGAERDRVGGL